MSVLRPERTKRSRVCFANAFRSHTRLLACDICKQIQQPHCTFRFGVWIYTRRPARAGARQKVGKSCTAVESKQPTANGVCGKMMYTNDHSSIFFNRLIIIYSRCVVSECLCVCVLVEDQAKRKSKWPIETHYACKRDRSLARACTHTSRSHVSSLFMQKSLKTKWKSLWFW